MALAGNAQVGVVDRPQPAPGPGQVLVRVSYCGLCGSDKRLIRNGAAHVPGHEIAGRIVAWGPGAGTTVGEGDAVVVYIPLFCGTCRQCQLGYTNRCLSMTGLVGWQADGGFAEYVTVPERNVLAVPDDIPLALGVLSLDTVGTAAHGLHRLFDAAGDDTAAVIVLGCGPLGMGVVAVARRWGKRVLAYDVDPARSTGAASLGAEILDLDQTGAEEVRTELNPLVVDASGSSGARALAQELVGQGGAVLMLGEGDNDWVLPASVRWRRTEASYVRSFYFPVGQMPENWDILRSVGQQLSEAIVTIGPIDDVPNAFADFLGGSVLKPIIDFGSMPADPGASQP